MKLGKKIVTLGLVGMLTIGQSISALAGINFTLSTPTVQLSATASGYRAVSKCGLDAGYANYYLRISHCLGYPDKNGNTVETYRVSETSRSVTSSFVSEVTLTGSETSASNINSVIARGYYGSTAGSSNTFIIRKVNKFR